MEFDGDFPFKWLQMNSNPQPHRNNINNTQPFNQTGQLICVVSTYLLGAFDCKFLPCYVRVQSESTLWNAYVIWQEHTVNDFPSFPFEIGNTIFPFGLKIQNFHLSWNFVPGLIRICKIRRWCSFFFCFRPFLQVLFQKFDGILMLPD